MAIPRDARYTDRSRRTVQLASGERVSRAQAENIHAQSIGYRSNYERRQAFRHMRGQRDLRWSVDTPEGAPGQTREDRILAFYRLGKEYEQVGNDYRAIDKSPTGNLANWLRSIGRKADYVYAVGESPATR